MSRIVGRRILGHRLCACGCGRMIALTTRRPNQRYYERECCHAAWARSMVRIRAAGIWKLRRGRFGAAIARVVKDGRIRERALLELCVEVYRCGYNAGHVRGRMRRQAARLREAA
jgi:hypothetical protein